MCLRAGPAGDCFPAPSCWTEAAPYLVHRLVPGSRRAAPCGTAAAEASGLVDLSVSVRERDLSETSRGRPQEGEAAGALAPRQELELGLQVPRRADPLLEAWTVRDRVRGL